MSMPGRSRCPGPWPALAAAGLLSCSPAPPPLALGDAGWNPEGRWTGPAAARRVATSAATAAARAPRPAWEDAALLPALRPVKVTERSEHLGGGFDRRVLVNDLGAAYERLGPGTRLPAGALVVQIHRRHGDETPAAIFAMRKHGVGYAPAMGDWEYVAVDDKLRVAAQGTLEQCARCHLEAPYDSLFGTGGP
ncbi:MAG: hypothetical protein HY744_08635 [Deltaproteobacteria bacterium]|nr:hypothetical protein [Deltaproteobacteria bacterium]